MNFLRHGKRDKCMQKQGRDPRGIFFSKNCNFSDGYLKCGKKFPTNDQFCNCWVKNSGNQNFLLFCFNYFLGFYLIFQGLKNRENVRKMGGNIWTKKIKRNIFVSERFPTQHPIWPQNEFRLAMFLRPQKKFYEFFYIFQGMGFRFFLQNYLKNFVYTFSQLFLDSLTPVCDDQKL